MEKEKWDYDNAEKIKFSRKKETIKYVNKRKTVLSKVLCSIFIFLTLKAGIKLHKWMLLSIMITPTFVHF